MVFNSLADVLVAASALSANQLWAILPIIAVTIGGLVAGMYAMSGALAAMGSVAMSPPVAIGLLLVSALFLSIGAAIWMAAQGMASMIESTAGLASALSGLPVSQVLGLAGAVALLAASLTLLANPFAWVGIGRVKSLFEDIGDAATPELAATVTSMQQLVQTTTTVTPEQAEATDAVSKSVTRMLNAADAVNPATLALLGGITALMGALPTGEGGGEGGGGQQEIKLYMDYQGRREFAKGIVNEMTTEMDKKFNILKG